MAPFPAGTAPHVPGTGRRLSSQRWRGGRTLSVRTQGTVSSQGGTQPPRGGRTQQSARCSTSRAEHAHPGGDFHAGAVWHRRDTANAFFLLQCFSLQEKGGLHPAQSHLPRTDTSLLTFKRKIPGEIRACFPTLCFSAEQFPSRHPAGGEQAASRGLCRQNGGPGSRALFQLLAFLLPGFNLIASVAFKHKSSQGSAHRAGSSEPSQTERVLTAGTVLRALLQRYHAALQWLRQQ